MITTQPTRRFRPRPPCQFCGEKSVARIVRRADPVMIDVCGECFKDAVRYGIWTTPTEWEKE